MDCCSPRGKPRVTIAATPDCNLPVCLLAADRPVPTSPGPSLGRGIPHRTSLRGAATVGRPALRVDLLIARHLDADGMFRAHNGSYLDIKTECVTGDQFGCSSHV